MFVCYYPPQLPMAESAYLRGLAIREPDVLDSPRHSAIVRITHWITALSFLALLLSGIAILLAHPRRYWGETGAVGTPSLIDLPLPFVLDVPIRGPGRYLHRPRRSTSSACPSPARLQERQISLSHNHYRHHETHWQGPGVFIPGSRLLLVRRHLRLES
jgi:hypothetical protein